MNKFDNDKKNTSIQEDDEHQVNIQLSVPISVLVSAAANTVDIVNLVFNIARILVIAVLSYEILGKTLFVGLIVTPILVGFIYYCFSVYYEIVGTPDDFDFYDDDEDDEHFKKM